MILRLRKTPLVSTTLLACAVLVSACSSSGSENNQTTANTNPTLEQPALQAQNDDQAPVVTSEPIVQAQSDDQAFDSNSPEAELTSIITTDNANAIILQAFEVFSGRAYDRRLTAYPYVRQAPSLTPARNALGEHFYYETLACENNGEKSENIFDGENELAGFIFYDTTYANCVVGGEALNGRAVLSGDTCCTAGYQKEFSNDFSVAFGGGGGRMDVSGIYRYEYRSSPEYLNIYPVSVENFNYELAYSGGALSILNATTRKNATELFGSFQMSPPVIGNQPLSVDITQKFENSEERLSNLSYARGVMRIQADDSEIILNADNQNPDTVTVTINARGETITRTEPWSNWFDALSYVPTKLGQDTFTLSPNGDGSLINEASYASILTEVFNVLTGDRMGSALVELPDYPFPNYPSQEMQNLYGFGAEIIDTCNNGETAAHRPFRWGSSQITTGWRSEFNNCQQDGRTFNGGFSSRSYGNIDYFSPGLTVSNNTHSSTFKGYLHYKSTANRSDGIFPPYRYQLDHTYFESTALDDQFVISDADFLYIAQGRWPENENATEASYSEMTGTFALSSAATNQSTIKVLIPDPLHFEHPDRVENITAATSDEGVLHINAGNGNELFLNAFTGDSNTFNVLIYQPGQEAIVVTEQWQDWQHLLGFNFDLRIR